MKGSESFNVAPVETVTSVVTTKLQVSTNSETASVPFCFDTADVALQAWFPASLFTTFLILCLLTPLVW